MAPRRPSVAGPAATVRPQAARRRAGRPGYGPARTPDAQGYGLFRGGPASGAHRAPSETGSFSNGRPVPPRGEPGPRRAPTSGTTGSDVGEGASHGVNGASRDGAVPSQRAGTEASGPSYQQAVRRRRADGESPPFGAARLRYPRRGDGRRHGAAAVRPTRVRGTGRPTSGTASQSSARPSRAVATPTRARRPRPSRCSTRPAPTNRPGGSRRRLLGRTPRWSLRRVGSARGQPPPDPAGPRAPRGRAQARSPRGRPHGHRTAPRRGPSRALTSLNRDRQASATRSAEDVHPARRACPARAHRAATLEGERCRRSDAVRAGRLPAGGAGPAPGPAGRRDGHGAVELRGARARRRGRRLTAGDGLSVDSAFAAAIPLWLAAHQIPLALGGQPLSVLPLLPTVAVVVIAQFGARWSARKLGGRFRMDGGPRPGVDRGRARRRRGARAVRCYPGRPRSRRQPWAAMVGGGLIAGIGAVIGVLRACGLPPEWSQRIPDWGRVGARARASRSWRCSALAR